MAPKKVPGQARTNTADRTEKTSAKEKSLNVQDVRAAVLRLVELAAAFESRGFAVDQSVPDQGDAKDLRTLEEVTNQLLKSVKSSRR